MDILPGNLGVVRLPGDIVHREATQAHRVVLFRDDNGKPQDAWTLFTTGPKIREWGFHCPKGWIHWTKFTDSRDSGAVGKGCDQ